MDLRKSLALCLALFVAVAFATNASAQAVGDPAGYVVRVTEPDSAAWAGIGDSIFVTVTRTISIGPAANSIFVGLFRVTDTLTAATVAANVSVATTTLQASAQAAAFNASASWVSAARTTPTSTATNAQSFRFAFGVDAGDAQSASNTALVAQAMVDAGTAGTEWKQLTNISTAVQSDIAGLDAQVGDLVKFGIDGQRPINGSYITAVGLATADLGVWTGNTGSYSFKAGDDVEVSLTVSNIGSAGIASARVMLFDALSTAAQVADSAYSSSEFAVLDLATLGTVTSTFTASATPSGAQLRAFPNNKRVKAVAFLVDKAGNLSADAAGSANPVGYSDATVYVGDTDDPDITIAHPVNSADTDSSYFTGKTDTSIATVTYASAAVLGAKTYTLRPLKYAIDEGVTSSALYFSSDDSLVLGAAAGPRASSVRAIANNAWADVNEDQNGVKINLKITAVDSVGNASSKTVNNVTFDQEAPQVTAFFPSRASLGQTAAIDTFNAVTADPVFTINEVADSISIRFIQLGTSSPKAIKHDVNKAKLTAVDSEIEVSFSSSELDELEDDTQYNIQVFIKDLAGNVNLTAPDTLLYDEEFANPASDSFIVEVLTAAPYSNPAVDSQLVGTKMKVKVTAIDTQKTRVAGANRAAVTFDGEDVLVSVVLDEADAAKLSQVKLSGTGVDTVGLYGTGTALLSGDDWTLGVRTVEVYSELEIPGFTLTVEDTSTTMVDDVATKTVNFSGMAEDLVFDATTFSAYTVVAMEDGEETAQVQTDFQLSVTPVDQYGNESSKTTAKIDTDPALVELQEIFVEVSANVGDVQVPTGAQPIAAGGSVLTASAPDREGDGLIISVITSNVYGDTSVATSVQQSAIGRTGSLSFIASGGVIVVGAPAAPESLIVQDYLGASGEGDQGGFVLVSFPNSTSHAGLTAYRVYREIMVSTGLDEDGNLVTLETPAEKWVSWVTLDAAPVLDGEAAITQAVVPTLDGDATRWAVAAEKGTATSGATVAGKRVFTKESVQQMVRLLGVDPNRVFSNEELSQLFTPSEDYVKSILGDRKNTQFASLDPDLTALLSNPAVPQTIRTEESGILSSPKTITDPARAIDNIAPAAAADGAAQKLSNGNVQLSWTPSADDRIVAYSSYRGFAVPIAGVDHYEVWRGTSQSGLTLLAEVPAGSDSYTITNPLSAGTIFYRIDALDLDNQTLGAVIQLQTSARIRFAGPAGSPIYIVRLDGASPYKVDFEDFLAFAGAFQKVRGDEAYDPQADTNDDGIVNFGDFLNFAGSFGKTAVTMNGQPIPSSKPAANPVTSGVNESSELSMRLTNDQVLAGQTISVDVSMANVLALQGYGFTLSYDPTKFEFIEAAAAEEDLLKSTGGDTPLFFQQAEEGQITVANAIVDGEAASGEGSVATLTFRVLSEFEDDARFDIVDAVLFDGNSNPNPAIVLGSLEVQTTPTEFALLQNFPNPFNPETTIKYNLAEGANVQLRIYNIVGQVVKTLVGEQQSAGRYQVRWDGTDDRGATVSSGIYFYQVSAGKFQDVKRLMLLK